MKFNWQGRIDNEGDSEKTKRVHQIIKSWDTLTANNYNSSKNLNSKEKSAVLLGFAVDEGVKRNHGRIGAAKAPNSIRSSLGNYAWHLNSQLYDAGDVAQEDCDNNLEIAQLKLADKVATILSANQNLIVLGGGHETAFGHFLGIKKAFPNERIGIINFDAHFDLRSQTIGNSGTPFKQIADSLKDDGKSFNYLCLGISQTGNTKALFETAKQLNVEWISDIEIIQESFETIKDKINKFIDNVDKIYLTIDLDVLCNSDFFAVSAPAGLGITLEKLYLYSQLIIASNKVVSSDYVEYNPNFDTDNRCSKIAASLVWHNLNRLLSKVNNDS